MTTDENTDGDETVILARLSDAVEAGALRELLEGEGIAVSTPGLTHRSLLGIAGGYVDIVVRVPKKDLEKAKELFEGLRTASPPVDEQPGDAVRTDRLRRIAVFAALILTFGSGHFYARRWRAGFVLLGAELAALGLAFAFPLFWYAIPAIMLADGTGAVLSIGADQRGARPSALARAAPFLGIAMLALIPVVRFAAPGVVAGGAMTRACAHANDCGADGTVDACIEAAATRAFAGRGSRERERDCAACLDETTCSRAYADCAICDGIVDLPAPPVDMSQGPIGTRPEDMQHVVPDLFRHDDDGDGPTPIELEDMLRTLDALPPPPTTGPSSPAHP